MAESLKQKTSRAGKITEILENEYPGAKCHLDYKNPFQLLIRIGGGGGVYLFVISGISL
jgi:hypothetical protein